jgi:hypothetical protein
MAYTEVTMIYNYCSITFESRTHLMMTHKINTTTLPASMKGDTVPMYPRLFDEECTVPLTSSRYGGVHLQYRYVAWARPA